MKKHINIILSLVLVSILCGCQSQKLDGIYGEWKLSNNSLMIIQENEFYWYQNYQDKTNNYYYGMEVETLDGQEALDAIQVPTENKEKLLKTHTYYVSVVYSHLYMDNKDMSSKLGKEKAEFALQLTGKNQATIINLLTNDQYSATKLNS